MEQEKRKISHAFCAHCDAHINEANGCTAHESEQPLEFLVCPYCCEINQLVDERLQKADEQSIFNIDPRLLFSLRILQQKAAHEEHRGDASFKMKPSSCPTCQHTLSRVRTSDGAKPEVGDFSICCNCAALNRFDDDFNLVSATEQIVLDSIDDQKEAQQFIDHLRQQQQYLRDHLARQEQVKAELEEALGELLQHLFGGRK